MCAAPLCVRQMPASSDFGHVYSSVNKRCHRGCRSMFARLKRSLPKRCRTLPGIVSGETETRMPVINSDLPLNSLNFKEMDNNKSEKDKDLQNSSQKLPQKPAGGKTICTRAQALAQREGFGRIRRVV